jgi:NADH-quinone oxidoreductase subunit N
MNFDLAVPTQLTAALAPDLLLIVGALGLMLWAAWRPDSVEHQRSVGVGAIALVVATLAAVVFYWSRGYTASPGGPIAVDSFRFAADVVFLLGALATLALSVDYNARERIGAGESHVLVLFATAGMMILAAGRDLTVIFLGIELMSVATYVLAGMNRRSARSAESALKYFLLGAFSTGFLLYGMALTYGATGSTNLTEIGARVAENGVLGSPLLLVGVALLLVGFCFKVAAAPFHMWAPDVYDGAPVPIAAFMAAAVKAAAFAAFLRVWVEGFSDLGLTQQWHTPVWWLAVLTMVVGNIVALAQTSVRRLLAYSSVAHAGYVLVAVVVGTGAASAAVNPSAVTGSSAFLFYLLAYTLATMGAFGVVAALGQAGHHNDQIDDYAGLWHVRPGLAIAMSVFMLALLGFPLFGGMGFVAKYYMLQAALRGGRAPQTQLAVWMVITSVLSAGYYLRVLQVMFMRQRAEGAVAPARTPALTSTVIGGAFALILIFGLFPSLVLTPLRGTAIQAPGVPAAAAADPAVAPAALAR